MTTPTPTPPPAVGVEEGLAKLETELRLSRAYTARALREMYQGVVKDLNVARRASKQARERARAAEALTTEVKARLVQQRQRAQAAENKVVLVRQRAKEAEKRAQDAEQRARAAEAELAEVRASTTWRAGRAVVAAPARLRGLLKR